MPTQNPQHTFLLEAEDLLARIEETVLGLQPDQPAAEPVNDLFRAFHTIKGSGAMFGFDAVAAFTHHVETVLDQVREGVVPVSRRLLDLILAARDQIKAMLDAAQTGAPLAAGDGEQIIAALRALLPANAGKGTGAPAASVVQAPAGASARQWYRIRFRPAPNIMATGTNPRLLLDELRTLGECRVKADTRAVPSLSQLQPDQCYLAWDIEVAVAGGLNVIKDVFIFVEDDCELKIEPAPPGAVEPAPRDPPTPRVEPRPPVPKAEANPASGKKLAVKDATVRVPAERLDRLVALVGEMVMTQSRLSQVAAEAAAPNLAAPVEELERLVGELRDNVLGIRMMPIGTTFSRYKRLVHDLSAELGKEIDLVTEGAETELDKTVLDQLGEPLVHLIRNSIDHGIEAAAAREPAGKPRRGTIRLAAAHCGSSVVVTIQDDGRGLDAAAIRAKAVEKGLVAAGRALTEPEVFNLIFLPGFSTAQRVTKVSGRGVGMDVVRRQIDQLRGSIQLASEPGKGTTVSLTLPLTLAIIDGLLVEVGRDQFIIPMSAVMENVELRRADRFRNNGRNLISVRGQLVPYLRLRENFAIEGEELPVEKVVIVRHGNQQAGLVVDRVLGSHQTVIQSLGRFYRQIEVVSGATIMGDGRVALILDLAGVIRSVGAEALREPPVSAPRRAQVIEK
jgi:two-component system, chemotaxis family, sensor kinase CheA